MPLSLYLVLGLLLIISCFALSGLSFAPWVPVRRRDLPRILALAQAKPTDRVYDLGCGDGRVVRYFSAQIGCPTVGLEINPLLFGYAWLCSKFNPQPKPPQIKFKNLYRADLSPATVIFIFGIPDTVNKKFLPALASGTKIISYAFPIKDRPPLKIDKPSAKDIAIYLYQL